MCPLFDGNDETLGFNAATDKYEDLIEAGVIDPTKVVRFALQNAGSVASLMLTTEAMITDKPEDKADMPAGGGGGLDGGVRRGGRRDAAQRGPRPGLGGR